MYPDGGIDSDGNVSTHPFEDAARLPALQSNNRAAAGVCYERSVLVPIA
jgi:hypothetical protein